jgi:hypothetical protein
VLDNGNVGIGTTEPGALFDIKVTAQGPLLFKAGFGSYSNFIVGSGTAYTRYYLANGDTYHRFYSKSSGSSAVERLNISGSSNIADIAVLNSNFIINTNQLYVQQSSGNVGVGTTAPLANLQIGAGTNTVAGAPTLGANDALITGNLVVDGRIYGDGSGLTNLSGSGWTSATGKVYTTNSTDNVGIGTINPLQPLTINGNVLIGSTNPNYVGKLNIVSNVGGTTATGLVLQNTASTGIIGVDLFNDQLDEAFFGIWGSSSGLGSLKRNFLIQTYGSALNILFATQTLERMRVTNSGNVGIGTTAPLANFQVGTGTNTVAGAPTLGANDALITGNLVVDGRIYGDGSRLTGITAANSTATAVPVSTGTTLVDSGIYAVGGNVGIGTSAPSNTLQVNDLIGFTNADQRTQIGYQAGKYDLGPFNTWIGYQAGSADNATGKTSAANYNTAVGYQALFSNTTGNSNTAIGSQSLYQNTTGNENTAYGVSSLYFNTTGVDNTANGYSSLNANTTGSRNTATGSALTMNETGNDNVANGYNALSDSYTGSSNTAIGNYSLSKNDSGNNNTTLGFESGMYLPNGLQGRTTGDNGLYLGSNTKASADGTDNEIVIGYNAIGQGSNTSVYGNTSMTKHIFSNGNVGIGTTAPVAKLQVNGQYYSKINVIDGSSGTWQVDWNNANVQRVVLAAGVNNVTFANPVDGGRYVLIIKQPAAGGPSTLSFGATSIAWAGGSAPTLSTTAAYIDIFSFIYDATEGKYLGGGPALGVR